MKYLAYGSNLNKAQMKMRCPDAQAVGDAILYDYALLFKGSKTGSYLTIEKKKGSTVPVGVWAISDDDEKKLDTYEGYPGFYYKKIMQVKMYDYMTNEYKVVNAMVYIMHEERPIGIPSSRYMMTCSAGYMDFGFDPVFLSRAYMQSCKAVKVKRGGVM